MNDKKQTSIQNINALPENIPSPGVKKQSIKFDFEGNPIRISWAMSHPENVELYSNLKNKQASNEIKSEKNCKILINGGFYSTFNTHLGLVVNDYETISQPIQSALLNGFLSINSKRAVINNLVPSENSRLTLQSGPLLTNNGKALLLAIRDDQPARRMAAGTTNNNDIIFLAVYKDGSEFEGPLLGQLPEIIDLFTKKTNINIIDTINLDGGSASAFLSDFENLQEFSQIGSYFCAK